MTFEKDNLVEYPREVRSSTQRPSIIYTRMPGHYATRRARIDADPHEGVIATISEGDIVIEVVRGDADERRSKAALGEARPVYSLQPGGTPAVPTGQIFIRLKEDLAVEERRGEIEQAGYEITQSLAYAPNAAWLRARSGQIADALSGIQALEKIAGVENVEPQMLMERASR